MTRYSWNNFNKKIRRSIEQPHCAGSFGVQGPDSGMRLVVGRSGTHQKGERVQIELLVDLEDGIIADAKYQAFGPPSLIAASEGVCAIVLRKNYDQAKRIKADLIDLEFRDKRQEAAFPPSAYVHLNAVLEALEDAADKCLDIPIADGYVAPPEQMHEHSLEKGESLYPGWLDMDKVKKIAIIESVVETDIRPYVELDAGGVKIVDITNEKEILIAYQGACTTCYSSTGSTLSAIQQILRAKVYDDIIVIPQLASS